MKALLVLFSILFCFPSFASVRFFDNSGLDLGSQADVQCAYGTKCSQIAGKLYLDNQSQVGSVSASSQYLAATDCGKTIVQGAATSITEVLPEASTVPGCEFTFVSKLQGNLIVKPFAAPDSILNMTIATGASVLSSSSGNILNLRAVDADSWAAVGSVGRWFNNN